MTIDLDAKDVEVYSTRKEQVVRSYKGEVSGRVHAAHWAQAGTVLAADLLDGRSDGRTVGPAQIDRAVDAVRAAGASGQILVQGDSGYYAGQVAEKIVARPPPASSHSACLARPATSPAASSPPPGPGVSPAC